MHFQNTQLKHRLVKVGQCPILDNRQSTINDVDDFDILIDSSNQNSVVRAGN